MEALTPNYGQNNKRHVARHCIVKGSCIAVGNMAVTAVPEDRLHVYSLEALILRRL